MAAKKSEPNHKTVSVTVPTGQGVAVNDIYKAALTAVRDDVPLVSGYEYELVDSKKSGDERTYQVKISWDTNDAGEPMDFVQHVDSLTVPTSLPAEDAKA